MSDIEKALAGAKNRESCLNGQHSRHPRVLRHTLVHHVFQRSSGQRRGSKAEVLVGEARPDRESLEALGVVGGPFSFELADEMDLMVSYWGLSPEPLPPFGVRLSPGQNRAFVESSAELSPTLRAAIEQVVSFVGKRGVVDLERLATTAWIRTRERITDRQDVARRLRALKPQAFFLQPSLV